MGEPRHTSNVRRIDFAKAGARQGKPRADEMREPPRRPEPSHLERMKVVSLPEPRDRRRRHGSKAPPPRAMLAVIIVLAALLGAVIGTLFLDQGP